MSPVTDAAGMKRFRESLKDSRTAGEDDEFE